MNHTINKNLLLELQKLEERQQEKVLTFIRDILTTEEINRRADASEKAISEGKVKSFDIFDKSFSEWKNRKKSMR